MTKKEQEQHAKHEAQVATEMAGAYSVAQTIFGSQSNTFAVLEIYDYLQVADADEFVADFERVFGLSKSIFNTDTPSPEQVFGLFDRIYSDDDEDEE